ncbi:MAG: tlyA [Burkholderiaceae bacterium]|nr:tlyA [Burkholderiaceae bacterium]
MPRIDQVLVTQNLAESRAHAQRLVSDGRVSWHNGRDWQTIKKASYELDDTTPLQVADSDTDKFVSRAGMKLAGALTHTQFSVAGLNVLDLGTSTGGFADCLLQNGAARVVGIDVGHDQLHKRLHHEPRLTVFENCNARYLDADELAERFEDLNDANITPITNGFDLAVADLSFISLTKILPIFAAGEQSLLKPNAHILMLVKPQFELDADALSKAGIVKDPARYTEVQANILQACMAQNLTVLDYFASPITGTDGNHEFFVFAQFQLND